MQKVSKIFIILCFSLILQAEFVVKSYQMLKNQNMVKQILIVRICCHKQPTQK